MRLIAERCSGEQFLKIKGVTLNGVLINKVLAADDKLGILFYYETDADGKPILFGKDGNPWVVKYRQYDKDGVRMEEDEPSFRKHIAHGKVEFVLREMTVESV